MPYNIIIGRSEIDSEKLGEQGVINIGKLFVQMGQTTSLSNNILLDIAKTHVIMIAGKRGSGKCLVEGTLIPLTDGSLVPIEKLRDTNQGIYALNDQLKLGAKKREDFFEREVNEVIRVQLRSGREITLTPEHPLLTIKGWKPVQELTIGSRIATPRVIPVFGQSGALEHYKIKLLAYLIAEGYFKTAVIFSNNDPAIIKEFQKALADFDPELMLVKEKKDHYRVSQPTFKGEVLDMSGLRWNKHGFDKGSKTINKKKSIRLFLEQVGIWGLGSLRRFIPDVVFKLPKHKLALFLNRLFSCDGSIYKTRKGNTRQWEICYGSSSKKMIHHVQHLLLRFGILSGFRKKAIHLNDKTHFSYELVVNYAHRELFIRKIGFFGRKEKRQKKCLKEIEKIKNNPNIDTIPKELWDVYRPANWAAIGRSVGYAYPEAMRERIHYAPARQTLLQVAVADQNNPLKLLAESDIFWDEIKLMECLEGSFKVYDIHVPKYHNFVANDIIVHNSFSASVIGEEASKLPEEIKSNLSFLYFDTMGVFWTMKYPNMRQERLLHEWNLEPEAVKINLFVPKGLFNEYIKAGIPADVPFAIKTSELSAADWVSIFDLKLTDNIGILIERVINRLKETHENYAIEDILDAIEMDTRSIKETRDAATNRFIATNAWGLFDKDGTKIADLVKPGTINVLDTSAYTNVAGNWNIKNLVIGIVCRKLLDERIVARKKEELEDIHSEQSYFYETEKQEKPLVWVVIDEGHECIPKEGMTPATDALVRLLREGRQPGISLILVTQQPGEVHKDALTQSDIIIAHRLTAKVDIEALNSMMQSYLYEDIQTYLNELPKTPGACIILDDNSERIYPVMIKPKRSWHGGEAPRAVKIKKTLELDIEDEHHA